MKLHLAIALLLLTACGSGGGSPATTSSEPMRMVSQLKCANGNDNRLPDYGGINRYIWKYEVDTFSDGSKVVRCMSFDFDHSVPYAPDYDYSNGYFEQEIGIVDICMEENGYYPRNPANSRIWPRLWAFGMENGNGKIVGRAPPTSESWNSPNLIVGQVLMAPIINIDKQPAVEDPSLGHCFFREL